MAILFQMAIGVSAFWIHEVDPFTWMWEKMLFALGGLIIPLSIYPEWCQQLTKYTPFPYILGGRSHLMLHFSWIAAWESIGYLILWFVIGGACLLWLYRKGVKVVTVEGG